MAGIAALLSKTKFSFIGLGMMASHFLSPLLQDNIVKPENIIGTNQNQESIDLSRLDFPNINLTTDNQVAAREGDIIFLGCKPTDLDGIAKEINGGLKKDALVISMLAAVSSNKISQVLQHNKICRCMPNTPVKIRQGVLPYTISNEVTEEHKQIINVLFNALGYPMYLAKESQLDVSTAISGSSPAYYFLILEALTDAAVHCGLPRRQAEIMAMKSMQGSVEFALQQHGKSNFAELKAAVTSPSGTTASALHQAEKHGLRATIAEIVWACYRRSLEIRSDDDKVYGPDHWQPIKKV